MTFLEAIQKAKEGKKITNSNWKYEENIQYAVYEPDTAAIMVLGTDNEWQVMIVFIPDLDAEWEIYEDA